MFHTDQIGMHYNEATQLTNSMFSKAQQQTCAGESIYLCVCGLSKPEVLINKCTNIGSISVWVCPIMARCSIKLTGPPIITKFQPPSQPPCWETRKKEGVQLLWSHVLMCSSWCCLNMSLFCPCYIFQPQSLSMICKCRPLPFLSHLYRNYFGLRRGISIFCQPAAISSPLTWFMRVFGRERREWKGCGWWQSEPEALSQTSIGSSFDCTFTAKNRRTSGSFFQPGMN